MNATMPTPAFSMPEAPALHGVVRLLDWGLIRAEGSDAAAFLHGQLTQDFLQLDEQHARLAAYCTPKGRMLLSAYGLKDGDGVWLCAPRSRIGPAIQRLRMFVLRAKVQLSDASDEWALWGVVGAAIPQALPEQAWSVWREGDRSWLRLYPGAGQTRALLIQPAEANAPEGAAIAPAHWAWLEVMSAVAPVTDPVVEAFVPQMLNYESVGGVHFKKGCYPGQEVVARSQFRGTLKRRAYLAYSPDGPLAAGQDVYHPADAEQPAGIVALAAPHPVAGWNAILSLQTSAADGQPLTAGAPDGPALHLLPLPYPLLQDV
jgi:folate-binding protein YgfZ